MGCDETTSTGIGIKIKIKDLLKYLNKENETFIEKCINDGIIDDHNSEYNESLRRVISKATINNDLDEDILDFDRFKKLCEKNGDIYFSKFGGETEISYKKDDTDNLLNQFIIINGIDIISFTRWGYDRTINASSVDYYDVNDIVFKLKEDMTKKNIPEEDYKIVFYSKVCKSC
jgi:hypothetical protein